MIIGSGHGNQDHIDAPHDKFLNSNPSDDDEESEADFLTPQQPSSGCSKGKWYYGCDLSYLGCDDAFSDLESWERHHKEKHSNIAPQDVKPHIILDLYCCTINSPMKGETRHRKRAKHLCSKRIGKPGGTSFLTSYRLISSKGMIAILSRTASLNT